MANSDTETRVLLVGDPDNLSAGREAVREMEVRVDHLVSADALGSLPADADLVMLDRGGVAGPDQVRGWIEDHVVNATTPLLLFASAPVDPDEYRAWLSAGVWEVMRRTVDPELLRLRLRNLLWGRRSRGGAGSITPHGPYSWPTLQRATEETLALGRRYDRPVSCVALAVDTGEGQQRPSQWLMYRLGVAAGEWARRSDLVGISEHDVLLVVLPDTSAHLAGILGPRLVAALERSLQRDGTVARIRFGTTAADGSGSGTEFLLTAARTVS